MMRIFVDMDGVLADFDGYIFERFGNHWGDLPSEEQWKLVQNNCQNIYSELKVLDGAYQLMSVVNQLSRRMSIPVSVLTAIPKCAKMPLAVQHKYQWIEANFKHYFDEFRIGPYAIDKQLHCTPGDILIDDSHLNIPQWIDRGGQGILYDYRDVNSAIDQLYKMVSR